MSLSEYNKKRSFTKTPEPSGATKANAGKELLFVVQKHAASHLHYDFRLEMKGTLKSWAVPKGPSINPEDKRLAMLVEDHPFDYKDFEGIIPKGNYGAGTVIVWDQGTYEPAEPAKTKAEKEKILLKGFYSGSLRLVLNGSKLKGEFALVQSKGREDNAWLLIKKHDRFSSTEDITLKDKSVVSKKTLEQVAGNKNAKKWISNRKANGEIKNAADASADDNEKKTATKTKPVKGSNIPDYDKLVNELLSSVKGKTAAGKKSEMPKHLKPMLATLVDKPFDDDEWIYEVKWDGYRALAYLDKGSVDLRSRNNNDFTTKFSPVSEALQQWPIRAIVDGEIVVVNEEGLSTFSDLQNWGNSSDGELVFYVFDLLWLDGITLMTMPLIERRKILARLVPEEGIIKMSDHFETSGIEFFEVAKKMGLEGIIAKKADSLYKPDTRTKEWLKIKTEQRHEAVIAGYTRNEGSGKSFSALILGIYEKKKLKFIGQAGTGFTDKMQTEILKRLKPLETETCPFPVEPVINKPTQFRRNPPKAAVTWVKPELSCIVKYQELSNDGIMRHPSFQGLKPDGAQTIDEEEADPVEPLPAGKPTPTDKMKKKTSPKGDTEMPIPKKSTAVSKNKVTANHKTKGIPGVELLNAKDEVQTRVIDGHKIQFNNLNKLYWPKEKITKRDMLNYYMQVAPYMFPYMKDRPQSLNRYPGGIHAESFYQKNVAGKVEPWMKTHAYENTTSEGKKTFLVCADEASLMYIAKLGCIEMNPWHSRIQAPNNPDWCVIDLDPDDNPFEQVIEAARVVHEILESIDVPSYPKTSGSTGIHIYIPLGALYDYEQSKQLAELIVQFAHQQLPAFTSLERSPAKRKGKLYLDYLQNRAIQTIAAPYSLRPKPGATASAPLHWDEVKKGLRMQDFTMFNMLDRIASEGDLFAGVLGKGINLKKVLEKINSVFG